MRLLAVNTGSSSVRLVLARMAGDYREDFSHRLSSHQEPAEDVLRRLVQEQPDPIDLVVHRVVHGGTRLREPCRIDQTVEAEIERLIPLAPLHNPRALSWIKAARTVLGTDVLQVAVFDTAFYADLPAVASTYALPRALSEAHGLRRYGFHGLAHEAMWRRWRKHQAATLQHGRVISLQLGSGCSITATRDGRPIDTSMGFSPLEGLVMATRSGDVDAGLLLHLQQSRGMTAEQLEDLLTRQSGLSGLSGISADMQRLIQSDAPEARLAIDVYCYRARKYVGAYLAALGGADAVVFGGGVGENAPLIRARILEGLEALQIRLDVDANQFAIGKEARISRDDSEIEVWVIAVNEARLMAEHALNRAQELTTRIENAQEIDR